MDKRALSKIPRPSLSADQQKILQLAPGLNYLLTVQRETVNEADTLIVNYFIREEKELTPHFRTFLQPGDFISQDLTQEKVRWKTAGVDYLTDTHWWHAGPTFMKVDTEADHDRATGWIRDNTEGIMNCPPEADRNEDVSDLVERFCNQVKGNRLKDRHDKEKAEIDRQMDRFGALPDDYQNFVEHEVFDDDNFFFYSRKKGTGYCTRCKKEYELKRTGLYHAGLRINPRFVPADLRHGSMIHCPFCDGFVTAKSDGRPRGKMIFIAWSVLVQRSGEDVLVRYFRHVKDLRYGDYREPEYSTFEAFRTVHTADGCMDYMWDKWKNTEEYRWGKFHMRSTWYWSNTGWNYPNQTVFYERNYEQELKGTCMQYSCLNVFINRLLRRDSTLNSPWAVDKYFNLYRTHQYLEQLIKVGMYSLARDVLDRPADADALGLKHGRTICQSLGISKAQYRMLRQVGSPKLNDLKVLMDVGEIPNEDYQFLCVKFGSGCYSRWIDAMRHTTVARIRRYMEKQGIDHDSDYFDYLGWLEEMGYDTGNTFNLFPPDFRKRHDEKSAEYTIFTSRRAKEEARIFNEMMRNAMKETEGDDPSRLKAAGLFIRPPYELDELKKEGEYLHHCVATYANRVAKGETMIFFIRRIEDPDTPYYTMEWKNGKMVQCRGKRNCEMTPEVKAFTCMFSQKMHEYESGKLDQRKARRKAG